ncbi:MAG: TraB/GumN family protein [Proteobacteria bacterium]|nr:TraB/GumN family protein [Pseudomonadota bacterium]
MPSFFRTLQRSCRTICALIFIAIGFASDPALADDAHCQGTDMLAEMQAKKPDIYAKVMAESKALSNTEAMLWKVEKPGVETSYLFGTMHLSDPRIAELPPAAIDAIAHAKSVALEVADLSPEAMAAAMANAAKLIVYTDGQSLKSMLSDDDYKKVVQTVVKSGMPGEFAALMKPWLVSMLLATSDCERKQVASGKAVLDLRVAAEAQKHGITVTGLETIESQLGALASIPDDQQLAILKVELDYIDRADDMMETMVQMYAKRQIGAAMPFQLVLAAESGAPPSTFDGFKKALLIDRNGKMRDAALPLLEKGNAFVAIGALHLPGPGGLVALLRESGYTVTPVE